MFVLDQPFLSVACATNGWSRAYPTPKYRLGSAGRNGIFNNTTRKKEQILMSPYFCLPTPAHGLSFSFALYSLFLGPAWSDYTLILKQSLALSSLVLWLCYLFSVPTSGHLADYRHFLFLISWKKSITPPSQIISVPSFSNYFHSSPSILTSELLIFILVHYQITSEPRFQNFNLCITTRFVITFVNNNHLLQLFEHHLSLPFLYYFHFSDQFQKTTLQEWSLWVSLFPSGWE